MKLLHEDAPIYLQLRAHIEERILNRILQEEEAVPSFRNLARDYQINPITVSNALGVLLEEGILYKKRGVGIYVSPGARAKIIKLRYASFVSEKLEPILRLARQLEVPQQQVTAIIESIYGEKHE